ncbi:MAG: DUF1577 domain-containing protein [Spirochaetota bacterium]|nr:DUF1577 domain-containing protein [Spirochaetota bacterium]
MEVKHRRERDFEDLNSYDNILELLGADFRNRDFHLKHTFDKSEVRITEILDDGSIMIVTDPDFMPEDKNITIYGLLDRYLELNLDLEEVRGPGYFKCKIDNIKRATRVRKDIRFKVNPDDVVATNFKVSKHTIDITNFKIPTSIKVILDQFQSRNSKLSDIVKVDILEYGEIIFDEVKKTGKALFIEDTSKQESHKALTEDFIDLYNLLGDQLETYMKKNIERGYKSLIICPVIYISETEESLPFAYIQIISKGDLFTLDRMIEIKELSFNLVDRIRDANTILLQVHQQIIDISRSGAKIKISNENLKKYLVHSKGFIFDIVFKLQAPITIYAEIRCIFHDNDNNMYIGVDFEGNSSREDEMKRFNSILEPMIKDYKKRLIKEVKQKR